MNNKFTKWLKKQKYQLLYIKDDEPKRYKRCGLIYNEKLEDILPARTWKQVIEKTSRTGL